MNARDRELSSGAGAGREVGIREVDFDIGRLGSLGGGEPRGGEVPGTRALMLAILEDGIRSYLTASGRVRLEAEYWVATNRRASPFSFVVVCETLGLEAGAVRAALQRMRKDRTRAQRALRRSRQNVRRTGRLVLRKRRRSGTSSATG
jgi:hypothetical protein